MAEDAEQRAQARYLAEAAADKKALQIVAIDMREVTSFADTFILATGTSDRHVRAVTDAIVEASKAAGNKPLGIEGYDDAQWVLVDLGDVVFHVFQGKVREHYDLDRLWGDAPRIALALAEVSSDDDARPGLRSVR